MWQLLYRLLIQRINENRELRRNRSLNTFGVVPSKPIFGRLKRNIAISVLLVALTMLYL